MLDASKLSEEVELKVRCLDLCDIAIAEIQKDMLRIERPPPVSKSEHLRNKATVRALYFRHPMNFLPHAIV